MDLIKLKCFKIRFYNINWIHNLICIYVVTITKSNKDYLEVTLINNVHKLHKLYDFTWVTNSNM